MPGAVSDSSVLIHLSLIGRLNLLRVLYGSVIIPRAVWKEVVEEGKGRPGAREVRGAAEEGWIEVRDVRQDIFLESLKEGLDEGEAEAIMLAIEDRMATLLVDETPARSAAGQYELDFVGVVGILMRAKVEGHIDSLKGALDELRAKGTFRISEKVYRKALRSVAEQ